MKIVLTGLLAFLSLVSGLPQSPEKMSYQAVIRNGNGQLVANKIIGMRISVLQGSASGVAVYTEVQTPATNANGLVSVEIGSGTETNGSLSGIDWAKGPYFIKIETDPEGGSDYSIAGISQLLSVPYAMYATTAEKLSGNSTETDPFFTSSVAAGITGTDTAAWNARLGSYTEIQNLADVIALNNAANAQIKNVKEPTDSQDAATKAYVDHLLKIIQTLQNGITDPNGNHYGAVLIGNQIWMGNDLKTNKLNDGTRIPRVKEDSQWSTLTSPGYCWYNNDSGTYSNPYGALYNWYTVETGKLCPAGWHLPTFNDLKNLFSALGGQTGSGGKLKESGTVHWLEPNTGATNESGFTAVPGGIRDMSGVFAYLGNAAFYWTDTDTIVGSTFDALPLNIIYNSDTAYPTGVNSKNHGFSVRCMKD